MKTNSPFDPEFQNKNIDAKITAAFERIAETYRVLLWEKTKTIKLSPIQIQILIFLKYHKLSDCTVNSLAQEFNMTAATISDAVSVLQKKNLLNKIRNKEDKRFQFLRLTPKGESYLRKSISFIDSLFNSVSKLGEEEKEHLLSSLLKIIYDLHSQDILITRRMCFTCTYLQSDGNEYYCKLLEIKLNNKDLRIDCPEHQSK